MIHNISYNIEEQEKLFVQNKICYLLEAPELHLNNYLSFFIEKKQQDLELVYEYEKFKLYRYKKNYCY